MLYSEIEQLSARDLCICIGTAISKDIKTKHLKKTEIAEKAGITAMSLYRLCKGENSSLETLIKVLKEIGRFDTLDALTTEAPPEPISYYEKLKKKGKSENKNVEITESEMKKLINGGFRWNG